VKAGVAGVVLRDDQILMVRRKYGSNKGKWCIPCGNVEMGEDVRDAVVREIKEETGLDVEVVDIVNVLSTHHTPERSVVGVWFEVRELGGNLVAGDDASEAQFYPLDRPPAEMAFQADKKIIEQLMEPNLR
jgi:ADP-ribose pyrophosphatase YjhB (NUDIX family)